MSEPKGSKARRRDILGLLMLLMVIAFVMGLFIKRTYFDGRDFHIKPSISSR